MTLAFLRFALASIFLAPFFFSQTKKVKIDKVDLPKLILVGIFAITLNITFFFEGIKRTEVINASVLTLIIPILSVLLSWIFLKEKIYLINLLGIFVGLFGALVIIKIPEFFLGNFPTRELLGNLLIIFASVSWVFGAIVSRQILKKYPSIVVTAIAFLVGTLTFFIPALKEYMQNPIWVSSITILGFLGVTYMTLLSSISAYFLFEWGLSKTTVVVADLFQYIEPFVASFLAILILGEKITTPFIFGSLLIILGVYLGTLSKEVYHRHHKTHRI